MIFVQNIKAIHYHMCAEHLVNTSEGREAQTITSTKILPQKHKIIQIQEWVLPIVK